MDILKRNFSKTLLAFLLIMGAGFLTYRNTLSGQFLWDDENLIVGNPFVKESGHWGEILTQDIGQGIGNISGFYRPLQILSYKLDYFCNGLNAVGYHATNVTLHILVALSIYSLINFLFKNQNIALWTSLLFIVHPVHVAAVAYISGRADTLAALFILLGLISYVKYLYFQKSIWILGSLLCYSGALLSKETSLIFPVLLWLQHFVLRQKIELKKFSIFPALALLYIFCRLTFLGILRPPGFYYSNLWKKIPGFFIAIIEYVRLLIFPVDLHMEYGNFLFHLWDPRIWVGLILVAWLISVALRKRYDDPLVSFAILWFLVMLLPVSVFPINAYMAEHWLYLPSIGFFLLLGRGFNDFAQSSQRKYWTVILGLPLLLGYSLITYQVNIFWKDSITLYRQTLQYSPESVKTWYNLGKVYMREARMREAEACFKKVLALDPRDSDAYKNLQEIQRRLLNK